MYRQRFFTIMLVIILIVLNLALPPDITHADGIVVTSTTDSGPGTLRQAILAAEGNPGPDTITFDPTIFPESSPVTIILDTPLPALTDSSGGTTIDGNGGVIITTSLSFEELWDHRPLGLEIHSNNNTIRGLQIHNFWTAIYINNAQNNIVGGSEPSQRNVIYNNRFRGIDLDGPQTAYNSVIGNYIGTNSDGTEAQSGTQDIGVYMGHGAHDNIIGGITSEERNIISGNTFVGVAIENTTTTNNRIIGNYIGTDYTGMSAIPNFRGGVGIGSNATGNYVGGTEAGSGNVISGHTVGTDHGIRISQTSGNYVYGNIIGLTAGGSAPLPNGTGICLEFGASNNVIGGPDENMRNIISGNSQSGISIADSDGNLIKGNFIGTDPTGTEAIGNTNYGVYIGNSVNNLIGGTEPGEGNLISGGHVRGILINGSVASNNSILGNIIGTDISGTVPLGNTDGIRITNAHDNIIGGTIDIAGNLISGNDVFGIVITGVNATGNRVLGNYIGTNYSGSSILGNGTTGILIDSSASENVIGGSTPGAGNLISGNGLRGIHIANGSSYNQAQGNFIGTDVTGTIDLGNGADGIMIHNSAYNTIGGLESGACNIISGNDDDGISILVDGSNGNEIIGNKIGTDVTGTAVLGNLKGVQIWAAPYNNVSNNIIHHNINYGVLIDNVTAVGNTITQNSITGNGIGNPGRGIYLRNDANQNIISPVITEVTSTQVIGTASSPDGSIIEIFKDNADQGEVYIGTTTILSGYFSYSGSIPSEGLGGYLTATVTDSLGNTSEFSIPVLNNLGTQTTPDEQIEEIQEIFDESVDSGDLVGEGPGNSSRGRIKAIENMLQRVEELIDDGRVDEAIQQLEDILKKVDGNPKPPDFISGNEATHFAELIQNLIDDLKNL
ncbi:MAG TPA: hypothetical protein G4O15_04920 [Dehalococcoidia bacterium]|nr:hypothetical protein [Dehalococcoidia bacterium]